VRSDLLENVMANLRDINFHDTGFTPASVRMRMTDLVTTAGSEALAARCMR
jgi:hypothetical protein